MTDQRCGPPERERPSPHPETGPLRKSGIAKPANHHQANAQSRQCHADTVPVQWRRRRQASYRCEPLADGHRDPWRSWRPNQLSDKQIDGAVDAARHLRDAGVEPLFDLPMLRAMWKAGHHQLVDTLRGGR